VIPTARLYPARVDKAGGSLLREHWSGIAGGAISSLTSNANYPSKPGGREFITSFECLAQNWADSYGTRVTGFISAAATAGNGDGGRGGIDGRAACSVRAEHDRCVDVVG
jgi:hypothetical protein